MHSPYTLCAQEVADALGYSLASFYRHRAKLETSGFPRPLPGAGTRWSKTLVLAWIDRGGAAIEPVAAADTYIADASAALARRYRGRAA